MQEITLSFNYQLLNNSELDPSSLELLNAAALACNNAYAPYSQFSVGAALICEDGTIITAANSENASYPLSICAEAALISRYRNSGSISAVKVIAIRVKNAKTIVNYPVMPCGGCRQILFELENEQSPITILLQGESGDIMQISAIKNLIPLAFSAKDLSEN